MPFCTACHILYRRKVHFSTSYLVSSRGPFPAFQCCIEKLGMGLGTRLLHTLITDIVDSQGGSSLLIKILGVCSSYDTLSRFIQMKAQNETPARTLDPSTFMVISADNIHYLHSYARVYNGKQESSWHGTSIQALQPNPTLSSDCIQGESSTPTCTSMASSRCTVEAPKDVHISYQLLLSEQRQK